DANGLYEGSAWYRLSLHGAKPQRVEVDARHIWAVFLNGQLLGHGHQLVIIYGMTAPEPTTLTIPDGLWKPDAENELLIFVDGLGHPKGFHDDAQTPQGLLFLKIDGQERSQDMGILGNLYSFRAENPQADASLETFTKAPLVRMKTEFSLPDTEHTE